MDIIVTQSARLGQSSTRRALLTGGRPEVLGADRNGGPTYHATSVTRRATADLSFGACVPDVNRGSGTWWSEIWWPCVAQQRTGPRWRHSLNRLRPGRVSLIPWMRCETCRNEAGRKSRKTNE